MLSEGPVSAEDLPFTVSKPVQMHSEGILFPAFQTEEQKQKKEKIRKVSEKRSLMPPLHLGCRLVLCSGWIPWVSVESLVLASLVLVLCVFLLWNIYSRERWKRSEIGHWNAQCPCGMDHIYSSVNDLAWCLELCGKCTKRCLVSIVHLYAVSYVEKTH